MTKKYKITRLPLPLYRYRRHDDNITNNTEEMKLHEKNIIRSIDLNILDQGYSFLQILFNTKLIILVIVSL